MNCLRCKLFPLTTLPQTTFASLQLSFVWSVKRRWLQVSCRFAKQENVQRRRKFTQIHKSTPRWPVEQCFGGISPLRFPWRVDAVSWLWSKNLVAGPGMDILSETNTRARRTRSSGCISDWKSTVPRYSHSIDETRLIVFFRGTSKMSESQSCINGRNPPHIFQIPERTWDPGGDAQGQSRRCHPLWVPWIHCEHRIAKAWCPHTREISRLFPIPRTRNCPVPSPPRCSSWRYQWNGLTRFFWPV